MTIAITEAKAWHCGQIARLLRHEHRAALRPSNVNIHAELRSRLAASCYARSAFIDGELCGIGGVVGSILGPVGYVWIALSERATKSPIAVARLLRRELDSVMTVKHELATVVVPEDRAALRLAVFLGFHVSDQGLGSRAHTRQERAALLRYLEAATERRIDMNGIRVLPVGYHPEEAC